MEKTQTVENSKPKHQFAVPSGKLRDSTSTSIWPKSLLSKILSSSSPIVLPFDLHALRY